MEDNNLILRREVVKRLLKSPFALDHLFSSHLDLLAKIEKVHSKIIELSNCENACATSDCYKLAPLIRETSKDFNHRIEMEVINTGTISKYFMRWGVSKMTYLKQKYLRPAVNKQEFLTLFQNSYSQKSVQPKIIIKGLNLLDACIDTEGNVILVNQR